jgi:predicted TIM-barrel fold metal-dependent hydrolase
MRAVREKKVFDMHVHAYETPVQGSNYVEENEIHARDDYVNYVDQLVASMDRHGIQMAALNPAFTTFEEVYETSYQPHQDRFILSAGFPPEEIKKRQVGLRMLGNEVEFTPQEVAQIYETQLTQYGAKLIGETAGNAVPFSLMPRYETRELHPVVDVLLKHDVPLQIHTGWTPTGTAINRGSYQTAEDWAATMGRFMASFPDVKLILAHTGGQFNHLDGWEAVRLLFSFDNVYCDTSKSRPDIVTEAVKGIGAERVMFGSDWNRPEMKEYGPYFLRSSYQHWHNLNTIANADLTEDQRDWVLYRSARKLLKLPEV